MYKKKHRKQTNNTPNKTQDRQTDKHTKGILQLESTPLSLNTSKTFPLNYLLISCYLVSTRKQKLQIKITNRSFRYASFCLWKQLFPIISSATSSSFTHTFTAFSRSISSLQFSPTATADSNVSVCLSHAGIAPSRAKAGS